jgi:hypothetical protein
VTRRTGWSRLRVRASSSNCCRHCACARSRLRPRRRRRRRIANCSRRPHPRCSASRRPKYPRTSVADEGKRKMDALMLTLDSGTSPLGFHRPSNVSLPTTHLTRNWNQRAMTRLADRCLPPSKWNWQTNPATTKTNRTKSTTMLVPTQRLRSRAPCGRPRHSRHRRHHPQAPRTSRHGMR